MTQIQNHDTEPLTYTVEETSRLIPLGLNQTYEAIRRGELPSIKIGRRILVPRQRLLEHLNGGGPDAA
jgi:excisionase family DNA binding protein